jgi:DUF4097 and DUF4098 domain-containing protein YvlB
MSKKHWTLGVVVLTALLLTAADASLAQTRPEVTEEFHQTYPLAGDGRVRLTNINGDVRVTAWDRNEVRVDAVKRASTQERLHQAQIKVDASPGEVNIETEYPDYRWSGRKGERYENPASVEYTLSVPRGARLDDFNLVNGALLIENVGGSVRASSVNGRMTAHGLKGAASLSVVNGRLEASLDNLNELGSVTLSSVNGELVVTLPSDANATVRASTIHGQIGNDFNLPVRVGEYVGRDLEGRLGQGRTHVRLSNVNGGILIRRAGDNRPLSPATNLLSETQSREDFDADANDARDDARAEARDARQEAREAAREAAREKREALAEAGREGQDDASRERAEEERQRAEEARETKREIEQATREIQHETEQAAREAAQEALKATKDLDKNMTKGRDDSARQIARESNSFNVAGTPRVRVETFDGAVYVHAWDKPEVMYTVTKRATDEREMQGIKIQAQNGAGSEVTLRADFDKSFARVYHEHNGRVTSFVSNASAEFDVYVPRNATLFVSTGDGRLRVEGVNGELELHTGDGSIDVAGAKGRLRAETGDGRIRVDNFEGDADARTGDGRISLDGTFKSLAARTGDGTISLSIPEGLNATVETDAESVFNDGVAVAETPNDNRVRRWRIGSGGQTFTLHSGEGQIVLRRR